ncbi:hypothetical protein [Streptomyces sp. NRRL B-24484]|uniref:hypothetical protein n=1 Tax=Streptomyces sp. NRRL B-24484 TaxID=1463833 RepID=UPI0004C2A121|nr:hypothetical protein [Streptomyces sp. NRRL B-24484]
MDVPRMYLGGGGTWLEMVHTEGEDWRVTASWYSSLTADFTAFLTVEEVAEFADGMVARLSVPTGDRFSARVTPGRNNPLTLTAEPVGERFAFFAWLTPNGDDEVCHLQMEINPADATELADGFAALRAALAG